MSAGRCSTIYHSTLALQVNGIDLRNATHDEAINVLRQTPQKVRLTVYRDEAQYKEEDMYDVLNIELQKKPGKGLGLSIVGKRYVMYLEIVSGIPLSCFFCGLVLRSCGLEGHTSYFCA